MTMPMTMPMTMSRHCDGAGDAGNWDAQHWEEFVQAIETLDVAWFSGPGD